MSAMKLFSRLACVLMSLAASPAIALTCADPDIVQSFELISAQDDLYFLLKGSITLEEDEATLKDRFLLKPGEGMEKVLAPAYGSFTGEIFHQGKFLPFDTNIEVRMDCIEQFCGVFPDNQEALYFATAAESNMWLSLEAPVCGGARFPISAEEDLMLHLEAEGMVWDETDAETQPRNFLEAPEPDGSVARSEP
jgi:hypothetical protein